LPEQTLRNDSHAFVILALHVEGYYYVIVKLEQYRSDQLSEPTSPSPILSLYSTHRAIECRGDRPTIRISGHIRYVCRDAPVCHETACYPIPYIRLYRIGVCQRKQFRSQG
jgi:hypothetical protein